MTYTIFSFVQTARTRITDRGYGTNYSWPEAIGILLCAHDITVNFVYPPARSGHFITGLNCPRYMPSYTLLTIFAFLPLVSHLVVPLGPCCARVNLLGVQVVFTTTTLPPRNKPTAASHTRIFDPCTPSRRRLILAPAFCQLGSARAAASEHKKGSPPSASVSLSPHSTKSPQPPKISGHFKHSLFFNIPPPSQLSIIAPSLIMTSTSSHSVIHVITTSFNHENIT
ncbi:hypothetical protein EK21DRAFT_85436 [Setomelanomma holmii]|uniref:Uncharacterized protein n=1 Tax=Setomelanomma holmii TaxID=210430 RepID=A0A9P4HFU2_9PLEO|nr:hypothetical protein EK21DRAFT_85436 [Setomelanomma holmii]